MACRYRYLPLLAAALAACGRCGGKPVALQGPEALAPVSAEGLLRVASISALAADAQALAKSVSRFPEGEVAQSSLDLVASQLGFDPRTPDGLAKAGVDGQRPAGLVFEGGGVWAAVPVSEAG